MTKEQLLAEVEDVLRTMPSPQDFADHDQTPWLGRAAAVLHRWNVGYSLACDQAIHDIQRQFKVATELKSLEKLLHQARADLRMEVGQFSIVVRQGQVFDYFDELRKMIEMARSEVFFVDAYLDADFVPRYLPYVPGGIAIRLLGGPRKASTFLASVEAFVQQYQRPVQVRTSDTIHERYLFVDQTTCYLSGASFKDGPKNAPAVLTQITDAFQAMWDTYERLWKAGKVERS